jgi:hypothetical protein
MANKKDIEKLLEDPKTRDLLKDAGYRLSRSPDQLVAKTFKLPKVLVDEFYRAVHGRDIKIQDGIEEAIQDWVKKNGG